MWEDEIVDDPLLASQLLDSYIRRQQWLAKVNAIEILSLVAESLSAATGGDSQPAQNKNVRGSLQRLMSTFG